MPQIITVEEAKRRKSVCSYYEEEDDDTLPVLKHHSALLENMHIEQVWLERPQVSLLAVVLSLPSVGHSAFWRQYQCFLRVWKVLSMLECPCARSCFAAGLAHLESLFLCFATLEFDL